jgi:hypothetical protein
MLVSSPSVMESSGDCCEHLLIMVPSVSVSTLLLGVLPNTILGDYLAVRLGLPERPLSIGVGDVRLPSQTQAHGSFSLQTFCEISAVILFFVRNSLITQWGALASIYREGSTDIVFYLIFYCFGRPLAHRTVPFGFLFAYGPFAGKEQCYYV